MSRKRAGRGQTRQRTGQPRQARTAGSEEAGAWGPEARRIRVAGGGGSRGGCAREGVLSQCGRHSQSSVARPSLRHCPPACNHGFRFRPLRQGRRRRCPPPHARPPGLHPRQGASQWPESCTCCALHSLLPSVLWFPFLPSILDFNGVIWWLDQVVVRCEEICLSGGLVRQKMKYLRFLRKRMNTKPSKGPIHFRSPARILWRTIRGYVS
jgi:hypothetical protein